jgi:hypothetical protein
MSHLIDELHIVSEDKKNWNPEEMRRKSDRFSTQVFMGWGWLLHRCQLWVQTAALRGILFSNLWSRLQKKRPTGYISLDRMRSPKGLKWRHLSDGASEICEGRPKIFHKYWTKIKPSFYQNTESIPPPPNPQNNHCLNDFCQPEGDDRIP